MIPNKKAWASYGNFDNVQVKMEVDFVPPSSGGRDKIKAIHDSTFHSMNQAAARLAGPPNNPMERMHLQETAAKQKQKKSAKKPQGGGGGGGKKREREKMETPQAHVSQVLPPQVSSPRIANLEQHLHRTDQPALFAAQVADTGRSSTDIVVKLPSAAEVLADAMKYADNRPWYQGMQKLISSQDAYTYPDVPVLSRKTIATFLREPNPRKPYERACFNPTVAQEGRFECIGHMLSERLLGKGKGFCLREMLLCDEEARIRNALENGGDPTVFLSQIPEMCILCHLHMALVDAIKQRDRLEEDNDGVLIINRFMVIIDREGEYDRTKMLTGDKVKTGIWGPFPLFQEDNYIPSTLMDDNGVRLRCFKESENLLFRPARVSSLDKEQKTLSSQSTHTSKGQRNVEGNLVTQSH